MLENTDHIKQQACVKKNIIQIFIVYDIIPIGFIWFLFEHFNCVITDDCFSNIYSFIFFIRCRWWLEKTNRKMVWNISFEYNRFKISIYKRIYKNMICYSWDYDPISSDWNFLQYEHFCFCFLFFKKSLLKSFQNVRNDH